MQRWFVFRECILIGPTDDEDTTKLKCHMFLSINGRGPRSAYSLRRIINVVDVGCACGTVRIYNSGSTTLRSIPADGMRVVECNDSSHYYVLCLVSVLYIFCAMFVPNISHG